MRSRLILLAAVSFSACGPGAAPAELTAPVQIPSLAQQLPVSAVIGQDAALTIFLWTQHWPETGTIIRNLLPNAARVPEDLEGLVSSVRPEWRHVIAALEGLDTSRPVVVRWGEAKDDLAAALAAGQGQGPNYLREVVALPTTDPARLIASIREGVAVLCPARGEGFVCSDESLVRIEERAGWVFLLMGDDEVALTLEVEASRSLTAVERWAMRSRSGFAFLLRPSRLRGAATFAYARERLRGQRGVSPRIVRRLAQVFLRYSMHGENFSELALGFDPALGGVVSVGQLSERGLERFTAAPTQPAVPAAPAPVANGTRSLGSGSPRITIRAGRDLSALVNRVPFAAGLRRGSGRSRSFHQLQRLANPLTYSVEYSGFTNTHLALEHRPELGADRVDAILRDRAAEAGGQPTPLHIRSRVQGAGWSAAVSRNEGEVPTFNADPATPSADDEAVACLERYALTAIETIMGAVQLDEEAAACARAGGLGADVDAYEAISQFAPSQ